MGNDIILPTTFSGIRPGEETDVLGLIADAGLPVQDLDQAKLAHFIVARKGDTIIGAVGLEPAGDEALLRSLAVATNYRKQSIATRLVAAIEKYARSHETKAMYLLTPDAADFFIKQSYQSIERKSAPPSVQATEVFRALCPSTAQCLCKHF